MKKDVWDHIDSFSCMNSHYLRAQTQREYIDDRLSIAGMYRLYVISQEENKKEYVFKYTYTDLLKKTEKY